MTIYWIVAISSINHLAFVGSRVAVSLFALDYGASQFTVGVLIALYGLCPLFLSIVIGKYADKVDTRWIMLIGIAGMAIGLLVPVAYPHVASLYFASFLVGLCNQLVNIPMEAAIGGVDGVDKRARNYSYLGMGFSLASLFGPFIAGVSIDTIGHRYAFLVLAMFSITPFIMLWLMPNLMPPAIKHGADAERASVLELLRIPHLRVTMIAGAILASAWDLFQFYLPIYGHSIGLSASVIGAIISVVAVATFVVRGIVPYLVKWLTEVQILTYSIYICALTFVLLPFFVNPYALGAIGLLIGAGVGCANPISMSLIYILTPRGRIAESAGLRKTAVQLTHLGIPLIFGTVGTAFGFMTVFLSNAVILTLGRYLVQRARMPRVEAPPK